MCSGTSETGYRSSAFASGSGSGFIHCRDGSLPFLQRNWEGPMQNKTCALKGVIWVFLHRYSPRKPAVAFKIETSALGVFVSMKLNVLGKWNCTDPKRHSRGQTDLSPPQAHRMPGAAGKGQQWPTSS